MSTTESSTGREPFAAGALPRDLTPEELDAAPVLESVQDLVIDGLTDEEYCRFLAAINE
ncbi:hypothetical protein [Aquihabitans sp. McL0605]|uniref:hypothetical protein n=1 Tax=Aquihabitans sp. McL0605 TaxID=3415671 RepID=UPI003CEEA546